MPMVRRVYAPDARGIGRTPYPVRTRSCSKAQSVAAARLRTTHEADFQLALGQPGRQLGVPLSQAVAGGSEHRVYSFWVDEHGLG